MWIHEFSPGCVGVLPTNNIVVCRFIVVVTDPPDFVYMYDADVLVLLVLITITRALPHKRTHCARATSLDQLVAIHTLVLTVHSGTTGAPDAQSMRMVADGIDLY